MTLPDDGSDEVRGATRELGKAVQLLLLAERAAADAAKDVQTGSASGHSSADDVAGVARATAAVERLKASAAAAVTALTRAQVSTPKPKRGEEQAEGDGPNNLETAVDAALKAGRQLESTAAQLPVATSHNADKYSGLTAASDALDAAISTVEILAEAAPLEAALNRLRAAANHADRAARKAREAANATVNAAIVARRDSPAETEQADDLAEKLERRAASLRVLAAEVRDVLTRAQNLPESVSP